MVTGIQSDKELWKRVKHDDDRIAFEQLYRRHMRPLYSTIYKWTDNQSDAEDILQEVFLDIWERRQHIEIDHHVFNYFYSITRYKVFDYLKDRQLSAKHLAAWDLLSEPAILSVPEATYTPGSLLDTEVARLPPQMKRVYELRFREGKSIPEIAGELSISPYTIKNHLQQIRKRLHALVARLSSLLFSLFSLFLCL